MERINYLVDKFKPTNLLTHSSIAFQCREICKLLDFNSSILEIGPSDGSLGHLLRWSNFDYTSLDVNKNFSPDIIGDFLSENFKLDRRFRLVCAFQVMEHTPLSLLDKWIEQLNKYSSEFVMVSLPDCRPRISLSFDLAFLQRRKNINIFLGPYDSKGGRCIDLRNTSGGLDDYAPHYWELGQGINVKILMKKFKKNNFELVWDKVNPKFNYHRFFCFKKIK
tara:strand:+ start:322 stop:987 length:666 start_codon:yes stop_codon:yes gene_type:complete